ncbi:MAG: DUF4350 domain-containing protein [Prochlorothrix sp.]
MANSLGLEQQGSIILGNPLRRWRTWVAVALGLLLLTVMMAPIQGGSDRRGSTYSRAPSGYGAWAAYMETRGTPLQTWEQSLEAWNQNPPPAAQTFIQIYPDLPSILQQQDLTFWLDTWVRQGHTLILLGSDSRSTTAPFRTTHPTDWGTVLIETSRRQSAENLDALLADQFGVIVSKSALDAGTIIEITPPYLGANAYQTLSGNYEFLAQLADRGGEIWIDEFIHGYHKLDPEESARDPQQSGDWPQYLLKTPLALILLQGTILLLLLIVAQNRRFGVQLPWQQPQSDNTMAYIQALGAVLYKAESYEFIVETIQKQELRHLQRRLGLDDRGTRRPPSDSNQSATTQSATTQSATTQSTTSPTQQQAIVAAWGQATGGTAADLEPLFHPPSGSVTESQVQQWLTAIDRIRKAFPDS